jgi:hypothetical protein
MTIFEIFSTHSYFPAHWIVDQQHDLVADITDTKSGSSGIVAYEHTFERLFKLVIWEIGVNWRRVKSGIVALSADEQKPA